MNKKIKIIISLVLLIIGVIMIVISIKANKYSNKEIIYEFQNFTIYNTQENEIRLNLDIFNNSENIINENKMYLNFYQDDSLLFTLEHDIKKMNSYDVVTIESILNFEYDHIDKYEIVINSQKKELKPYIINNIK